MEVNPTVLATVVAVIALGLAIYALIKAKRAGEELSSAFVAAALEDATTSAQELADVALTAAKAAEQLYRTGRIERTERLDHAFNYVKKWLPDIDETRILTAIEAAVFAVNSMVATLPQKQ